MAWVLTLSAGLALVLLSAPLLLSSFIVYQLGLFLIYGMAAQALGFIWSKGGILSLGQAVFFGLAAYATALAMLHLSNPFVQIAIILLTALICSAFAFLLAVTIFRNRLAKGAFFTLITLALGLLFEQLASSLPSLTGGFNGLTGYSILFGFDAFGSLYYVIVAGITLSTFLLLLINRLPVGILLQAAWENENRLQMLGYPTHLIKALAFSFAAFLTAFAGSLYAFHQGIVTPQSIGFALSSQLVIWAAVGGRFHVLGPLVGACVIGIASFYLRVYSDFWQIVLALVFIVVVIRSSRGIAGMIESVIPGLLSKKINDITGKPVPHIIQPATKRNQALRLNDLHASGNGTIILRGISLQFPEDGIVAVIGPNGAGKTSLFNTLTGNLPVTRGVISLDGSSIHNQHPYQARDRGIARKMQIPSVFANLSIAEHFSLASMRDVAPWHAYLRYSTLGWRTSALKEILSRRRFPLSTVQMDWSTPSKNLAHGAQQILEIVMAMATHPRILLLDEPCAGLSVEETALVIELIKDYRRRHNALVVIIEHDMSLVEALADTVFVLHQGKILASGTYDVIRQDFYVRAVYAGTKV